MSLKIAYIAPYKDASGYGAAARGYIRALVIQGHQLSLFPVRFDSYDNPDPFFTNLERTSNTNLDPGDHIYDVIVQHLSPCQLGKHTPGHISSTSYVAITTHETDGIESDWATALNKMKGIIVPCKENKAALWRSNVTRPIEIVPHCFNVDKYGKKFEKLNIHGVEDDAFKFYSIFQYSYKKGLDLLVPAYYLAFHNCPDDVVLVLRIYISSSYKPSDTATIANEINGFKEIMKLEKYPPIVIINHVLTDDEICSLHQHLDVFVTASRGEGWCIPAFDAMGFGSTPIATKWGGLEHYLDSSTGFVLKHEMVPCISNFPPTQSWAQPLLSSLIYNMRLAKALHDDEDKLATRRENGESTVHRFTYEKSTISEALEKLTYA